MRDAGILVDIAISHKAEPFVKAQRMNLRAEFHTRYARQGAKLCNTGTDQGRTSTAAALRRQNTNTADFSGLSFTQQAGGANGLAIKARQKVDCLIVFIVDLLGLWDALLINEHCAAQGAASCNVSCGADVQCHAK